MVLPALAGGAEPMPSPARPSAAPVSFNRDIRPILADNCFHCHGFDASKRKANLRLDIQEGATALIEGRQAVKPGDVADSELWRRITSKDPQKVMPAPESGKKLSLGQVSLLERWIKEGAAYEPHWSFQVPVRPIPPRVNNTEWPRNDIDRFILATLDEKGLAPSSEAGRETLMRRVTLDLTGLPPTLKDLDAFLADTNALAYERLVERLLDSPRYGEHMARYWLDLARYGDTHGLHLDNERSIWPYRDWVIKAFNENLPFDQFTIWQLAGDLLPNPTREQLVASGFNRCNVSTSEGGAIDEEFQVRYAIDRVETSSTTWLGLTMGCAVCHDHKLDPITQKEFYQVFSIFNNMDEKAMDGNALLPPPSLKLPTPEEQKQFDAYAAEMKNLEKNLLAEAERTDYTDLASITNRPPTPPRELVWVEDDFPTDAKVENAGEPARWISATEGPVFSGQKSLARNGKGIHQVYFPKAGKPLVIGAGDKLFAHVYLDPKNPPKAIMLQYHVNEWSNRANWGDETAISFGEKGSPQKTQIGSLPETGKWVRLEFDASTIHLPVGAVVTGMAFTQFDGQAFWDRAGQISANDPALDPAFSLAAWAKSERATAAKPSKTPNEIKELLKKEPSALNEEQRKRIRTHYLARVYSSSNSPLASLRAKSDDIRAKKETLEKGFPETMISKELEKPRPTWILLRGEYDKHGEAVGPGVPAVLPPLPDGSATNRLTFARWLVDGKHPLTGRVTANRFWQQFFGTGLVKTSEDFGAKGEWPSHPELLDWLATELPRSGWDIKAFVRLIVTSATYRQDSKVTEDLHKADPENRLLARAPRYRLDGEVLRDYALYAGGLLNLKAGGRGVRPYQPPGIWEAVAYTTSTTAKYTQDKEDALYRRSIYTFFKRTAPPPAFTTFDVPSREQCRSRRERTNTPLQALLTLNDIQYFEAARHLASRMIAAEGNDDCARLAYGFRTVTARMPTAAEADILADALASYRARYKADPEAAKQAISVGESPVPKEADPVNLGAYTLVANLLLNLDESLTRN